MAEDTVFFSSSGGNRNFLFLVARMLLVAMPGASSDALVPSSFLFLVRPGATSSSVLLLVAMPVLSLFLVVNHCAILSHQVPGPPRSVLKNTAAIDASMPQY